MAAITIPARKGKAALVEKGQRVRVVNTHGQQVVDTWAFNRADLGEFMSMEHTRSGILKLIPGIGDPLLTNHRRPILTLVEDTSGGIHDTLLAACDRWRYQGLGVKGHHDNCTDNLADGLAALGLAPPETPSPLNLFMNIPVTREYGVSFEPPVSTPGSYVTLRAEMDLVIAFSACPQDLLPINGVACAPVEAHFEILG
ncbi:MAG: urea carboxylase-associated family protein [Alphaproteobacteria bacterium]|nr:urea carboxylase-associated family protein [Alphaproteobacteria bacterium]